MKTEAELLSNMAHYCSQAERCIYDIRTKLKGSGLPLDAIDRICKYLIKERYIDENRYASSFVNDKIKFNHWGRNKIKYELRQKGINEEALGNALDKIDEDEYLTILRELLLSKMSSVTGKNEYDTFDKLCRFAYSKGYETNIIINELKKLTDYNEFID
jgi:regulatory protein